MDEFMEMWNLTYTNNGTWAASPALNLVCTFHPKTYQLIYGEYHPETADNVPSPQTAEIPELFTRPNSVKRIIEAGNSTLLITPIGIPTLSIAVSPILSSVDKGVHGYLLWGIESWTKARVLATSKKAF